MLERVGSLICRTTTGCAALPGPGHPGAPWVGGAAKAHRSKATWCDTLGMTGSSNASLQRRSAAPAARGARGHAVGFALAVAVYFSLALLAAQTLSLLHGILHSPSATVAAAAHASSVRPNTPLADAGVIPGGSGGSSSASFLTPLFSGHLGDADCRAYDQLGHFDAAPGIAPVVLPLVLTPFLLSTLTGLAAARWHALFQARGPPRFAESGY